MTVNNKELLRHIIATIAYRFTKSINNAAAGFFALQTANYVRTPSEIIRHMSHVLSFSISRIEGSFHEKLSELSYSDELERFYKTIKRTDEAIQAKEIEDDLIFKLVQGPFADVLTHIGQISMLRRFYNDPVQGENFMEANIRMGEVGPKQDLQLSLLDKNNQQIRIA